MAQRRYMMATRLSNTMDVDFCVGAGRGLESGQAGDINTDQGSQFTSDTFTGVLGNQGIQISMDGKGRYLDNIFGTVVAKSQVRGDVSEEVYLKAYGNGAEAKKRLGAYLDFYN